MFYKKKNILGVDQIKCRYNRRFWTLHSHILFFVRSKRSSSVGRWFRLGGTALIGELFN